MAVEQLLRSHLFCQSFFCRAGRSGAGQQRVPGGAGAGVALRRLLARAECGAFDPFFFPLDPNPKWSFFPPFFISILWPPSPAPIAPRPVVPSQAPLPPASGFRFSGFF